MAKKIEMMLLRWWGADLDRSGNGSIHDKAEDEKAVIILLDLPESARGWIKHHFRNCLQAIITGAEYDRKDIILKAAIHMLEDLDRIGC